jgi:threonine dehydrogenase-like Zn-dependent dehydrogenase
MQAIWLEEQTLNIREDVPLPTPCEGEALIKILLAGVCSTDLELVRGYYPFSGIPGHEFVGRVVSSPGDPSWIEKRVVGEINIACGKCDTCKSGLIRHCERRKTLGIYDWNGAFAEYLVLPLANLHVVPIHVPNEVAVFTEPLAAAHEILEQTSLSTNDRVLVIGAGRLGQLIASVIHGVGCHLDVIARHPRQRELLTRGNINIIHEDDINTRSYDVVVEATGTAGGFELAMKLIHPRGRVILKSTYKGEC